MIKSVITELDEDGEQVPVGYLDENGEECTLDELIATVGKGKESQEE